MRTTVTLDKDVEGLVLERMHKTRQSFKKTLNEAIRNGLRSKETSAKIPPFKVKAKAMGVRPGIDPAGFNRMADDLEVEAFMARKKANNE